MAKGKNRRFQAGRQSRRTKPTLVQGPTDESKGPAGNGAASTDGAQEQPLLQELRSHLRKSSPIPLLMWVSTIVASCDERSQDLAENPAAEGYRLGDLIDSFIDISFAETTAALTVMRNLVDEFTAKRVDNELANRHHPLPDWLSSLSAAQIEPAVWKHSHALGDGDSYVFGARLPSRDTLTALIYIDHNMGTVVKDAFIADSGVEYYVQRFESNLDRDQSFEQVDAGAARATIESAIESSALVYPPVETDTWPQCRAIIEWMLRMLPAGDSTPEAPTWTDSDRAALANDFFGSSYGAGFDHDDERQLFESIMWFGTDYGPGDPLRWSPINVEILLADWVPGKILAGRDFLAKLPELLRAFIAYGHNRQGISSALTSETLDAVGNWEPVYYEAIRSDVPQSTAQQFAQMLSAELGSVYGADYGDEFDAEYDEELDGSAPLAEIILADLADIVGGEQQLVDLTTDPLDDEQFAWDDIPSDIHPTVAEVLQYCDDCASELFDIEHRTAMRRLLNRVAIADPTIFRRKASNARTAATIAWVIGRYNLSVGPQTPMETQELLAWFSVKGSVSQRAQPMLRACGVDPDDGPHGLQSGDLLSSHLRADLIELRDYWTDELHRRY